MEFVKVIEEIEKGNKCKLKSWEKDEYIYLEKGNLNMIKTEENEKFCPNLNMLKSTDWEVCKTHWNSKDNLIIIENKQCFIYNAIQFGDLQTLKRKIIEDMHEIDYSSAFMEGYWIKKGDIHNILKKRFGF